MRFPSKVEPGNRTGEISADRNQPAGGSTPSQGGFQATFNVGKPPRGSFDCLALQRSKLFRREPLSPTLQKWCCSSNQGRDELPLESKLLLDESVLKGKLFLREPLGFLGTFALSHRPVVVKRITVQNFSRVDVDYDQRGNSQLSFSPLLRPRLVVLGRGVQALAEIPLVR